MREIQIRIGRAGAFRSEFRGLKGIGDGKPCVLVGFPFPFLANFTAPCQSAKGHQAIALAMIYPDPEKGGRGKKAKNFSETEGFSAARLSQALSAASLATARPRSAGWWQASVEPLFGNGSFGEQFIAAPSLDISLIGPRPQAQILRP